MTPRIIDRLFSEIILEQSKEKTISLKLSADAPLLAFLHPKMIKALLEFMDNPERGPDAYSVPNWNFACLADLSEAQIAYPQLRPVRCLPCSIGAFLKTGQVEGLFDLGSLGAFVLSKNFLPVTVKGIHQHLLPPFISYALSPELWGPQGKWARFHERLHTQFDKYKLLNGTDVPGLYPLKTEAKKLENRGLVGSMINGAYTISLPWTFSLSDLEELEKIIRQEF